MSAEIPSEKPFPVIEIESNSKQDVNTIAYIDPKIEKRLKWKLDLIIVPVLALGYICNSLDRSNLGNSKTAGIVKDLHLQGNRYNLTLTWFYIPYVIVGPFSTLATRHVGAKYMMPLMLICFGIVSTCTAVVKTYSQLSACRALLGIFEAGMLGSNVVYLSSWYTRKEIATRIAFFFGGSVFASAFGGLLAYGTFQLTPPPKYYVWSYLFLIEGPITIVSGFIIFFALPKSVRGAYFLTEEEKNCAEARILSDSIDSLSNKFSWSEALREFKTWHVYMRFLIGTGFGTVVASNSNFLAPIVQSLGYSVVKTNLYTVAPACVASVFLIVVCISSDRFQSRGFHMVPVLALSVIGYLILLKVNPSEHTGVAYFAIFLCTAGAYPTTVIMSAWTTDNIINLNARAFTTGLLVCLGHAAGLISVNIFFSDQAPRYRSALIGNLVCAAGALVLSAVYSIWMIWENKRRDRVYGPVSKLTAGVGDTTDPNFRFRP